MAMISVVPSARFLATLRMMLAVSRSTLRSPASRVFADQLGDRVVAEGNLLRVHPVVFELFRDDVPADDLGASPV
jgi:hypothetical protein